MVYRSGWTFKLLASVTAICSTAACAGIVAPACARQPAKADSGHQRHYRRADMLIAGSSCAVCLMRVERKLKGVPGVKKAAVSIYRPYPAIVIYDPDKTNLTEIINSLKGEPVVVARVQDEEINKVPEVIVPKAPEGSSSGQKPGAP